MKKAISIILLLSIALTLCACKGQIDENWKADAGEKDMIVGAVPQYDHVSVHEKGVFFLSQGLLSYYDYDSNASFVLCSAPNCSHSECVANAGHRATGFALYGGFAYYFRPCTDSAQWEFVRVNIQEQSETSVAAFGGAGDEENAYVVSSVSDVYYSDGKVWARVQYFFTAPDQESYSDNYLQLISIDLGSGDLYDLTGIVSMEKDGVMGLSYDYFGEGLVFIEKDSLIERCMSMEEYAASVRKDAVTDEEYYNYCDTIYVKDNFYTTTYVIDSQTMEQRIYSEGQGYYPPLDVLWMYDGMIYGNVSPGADTREERYQIIDPVTFEIVGQSLNIDDGGAVGWFNAGADFYVYNGNEILYLEYQDGKGKGKCLIYAYSLETGQSRFLFEDDWFVSFRLVGQTSDKLIGKINESSQFVWMYKADYEKGDFSKMTRFSPS